MAGFKFGIELDASRFKKGSDEAAAATDELVDEFATLERKGTSSLEDVAHAFGDISSAADRAGADIADEVTAGTDEAEAAARSLEQRFREALDGAGDSARQLSTDVGTAAGEIKGAVEDNAITAQDIFKADLKAELVANMAEAGAEVVRGFKDGFDGEDMGTVVDAITDTMVSVGALGGPVGVAAGLAGGAVVQMFAGPLIADAEAKAAQFEATFGLAFANIIESGANLGRELSIATSVDEFAQETEKMADASRLAEVTGISRGIALRAMAGDTDALALVQEAHTRVVEEGVRALDREAEQLATTGLVTKDVAAAADLARERSQGLQGALDGVTDSYETNTDALDAATEAAEAKGEADDFAARKAEGNASAMDGVTASADGLADSIYRIPRDVAVNARATGTYQAGRELDAAAYARVALLNMRGDYWQAQYEADRLVSSLRRPTIYANIAYGMRAV